MIRSRYGSRPWNLAQVFGAAEASSVAVKTKEPAVTRIELTDHLRQNDLTPRTVPPSRRRGRRVCCGHLREHHAPSQSIPMIVTRGLDPRVHRFRKKIDCRVKPGNHPEWIKPQWVMRYSRRNAVAPNGATYDDGARRRRSARSPPEVCRREDTMATSFPP